MVAKNRGGSLTAQEKQIAKALISKGWRLQDIQAKINVGRRTTVNSGRLTETKQDSSVIPAGDAEVAHFLAKKRAYDPQTGLNLFDDERLIRSREAMCLAVQIFNSPAFRFKAEIFAVLANIAWTYLLHEYYDRRKVRIFESDGRSLLLSQMIQRQDAPLSKGVRNNLASLKEIRDDVEHRLLARSDLKFLSLFQACCLNFDKVLCDLFGDELSLKNELGLSLQFSKLNIEQIETLQKFDVPEHIEALDARLNARLTPEELGDLEYQFRVIYTFDSATKARSHLQFIHPSSPEADQIRNVLVKYKAADELYPHKPNKVAELVARRSGKRFTTNNHTQAWSLFKVRPKNRAKQPENTNLDYCIYHAAHRDYTYSDKWVDFLTHQISTDAGFTAIKAIRV